ncbi:putative glycosyltransferase [Caldilinea aerophila DSM 14535 = NBRC 104270]|uniref:Putative glycosyltransferase n=2 Tax=Caldilineaceae TaxID=475964 RepID=I0I1E7_CALAS|nr:putative glycosyltransferase [Caldilinea aerophila DSM 14535 = NBRC 104270]
MMKQPLLTIAIPTYRRAQKLDKQLAWAVNAIAGRWDDVELMVSDNASPDETPQICEKWTMQSNGHLRVMRQPKNLGLIRNVLFCIEQAQGRYVWTVGDDDVIFDAALDWILTQLTDHTGDMLSFLHLNVRTQDGYEGAILQERAYPFQEDRNSSPGNMLFEECVEINENWMLLITANIYATITARAAIRRWPGMTNNLAFPLFLSGYAAAQGAMRVRAEPSLIYPHHTGSHLHTWLKTVYHDIPEAYLRLLREGYQPAFIRRRILSRASFLVFMMRFPLQFLRSLQFYFAASRLK